MCDVGIVCSHPCSGKTTRTEQLTKYLEQQGLEIHIINHETLKIKRNEAYKGEQQIYKYIFYYFMIVFLRKKFVFVSLAYLLNYVYFELYF
jgi:tRNA uridine 5-carbamoylmethylation protein Kti12